MKSFHTVLLFPCLNKCFLLQSDGEDELKKRQLMELAIINGTYRDSSSKNSSRKSTNVDWMDVRKSSSVRCVQESLKKDPGDFLGD